MNKCFKTKNNDQWATPKNIYNFIINHDFIDFNPLCENYDDSLVKEFYCDLFCNPPFSNIEPFVDYMITHCKKGYRCIMLLPVRSGTRWFKKLFNFYHIHVYYFTQRLKFSESNSAPFDCMLVVLDFAYDFYFDFINRDLEFFPYSEVVYDCNRI